MFADKIPNINRLLYSVIESKENTQVTNILGIDDFQIFFHIFSRIWVVLTFCFKTNTFIHLSTMFL